MIEPNVPHTQPTPASPPPASGHASDWSWVPIRSLAAQQRDRIAAHLLALEEHDRYLRFGYPATDAQISKYVESLDFERDELFGIFNRHLELIAMAHLAHSAANSTTSALASPDSQRPPMSEFGVSVLPKARGRGFGRRLFEHAVLHARNRGIQTLFIHALSENTAMLKIARGAGATVERDGSESEAWLRLPPDTLASQIGELVEKQAAELDYRLKAGARQVSEILDAFSDVKVKLDGEGQGPKE